MPSRRRGTDGRGRCSSATTAPCTRGCWRDGTAESPASPGSARSCWWRSTGVSSKGRRDETARLQGLLDELISQLGPFPTPWGIRIGLAARGLDTGPLPLPVTPAPAAPDRGVPRVAAGMAGPHRARGTASRRGAGRSVAKPCSTALKPQVRLARELTDRPDATGGFFARGQHGPADPDASSKRVDHPVFGLIGGFSTSFPRADTALYRERFIFTGERGHVHASSIVETPNGSLLAVWYENGPPNDAYYFKGGDEDKSDDVRIAGARLPRGGAAWDAPFVISDTFGLSDNNPALGIDAAKRLWLVHATLLAVPVRTWGSAILQYKVSTRLRGRRAAPLGALEPPGPEAGRARRSGRARGGRRQAARGASEPAGRAAGDAACSIGSTIRSRGAWDGCRVCTRSR